jgi:hypothetical protein
MKNYKEFTDTQPVDELSINTLRRSGSKARTAADTARDAGGTQKEREDGRRKASKKDAQAAKFDAAVDVKQRNTAFKKEDNSPNLLKKKKKIAQTISHPGYDAESKNEGIFGSTSAKKSRDKLFLAKSRGNTIKKDEPVNELSKDLLQRAGQAAKKKAGQQRNVSDRAASRVGDTSQPPGQNIKSKRADYQAAKKDYQAFKFDKAAKKKDESVEESTKPQSHEYFGSGPFSGDYNDVAASVMRVVEKTAKKNPEEEDKGFEKMSNDKLNKSVTNAYLEKVREEV